LFEKAAELFGGLSISIEEPWPARAFDEALGASTTACEAYAEALAESADPDLCREVEPHCPGWSAAVSAAREAHVQVLRMRAELRFRQIRWYSLQAELVRAVSENARRGLSDSLEAPLATEALEKAGLMGTTKEHQLWTVAADSCSELVCECEGTAVDMDPTVSGVRSRAQALWALKDLAAAHAVGQNLEAAVDHVLEALALRAEDSAMLDSAGAEQVRLTAQGVLGLCCQEILPPS